MTERTIRQVIEGREVVTASLHTSVRDAARLMEQRQVGALMVVDGEKLVGVFTERDGLYRVIAAGLDGSATPVSAVMTREPQTIHADCHFRQALQMMHDGGFRNLPVVEHERLIGVVSVRDAFGPELAGFVLDLLRHEQSEQVLA
jgi:CBS domain-containing protein